MNTHHALRIDGLSYRIGDRQLFEDLSLTLRPGQSTAVLGSSGSGKSSLLSLASWSYRRLDPAVARLFRLLGVHHGHDIDGHALAAMAGTGLRETRRALDVLVRAHLVGETSGGRYQPHDPLRAYAAELADTTDEAAERAAALTRLSDYYLGTASTAMDVIAPHEAKRRPKIATPDAESPAFDSYDAAFGWLDRERANLLVATQHGELDYVVKVSDTVWRYLNTGGYHDDAVALHTRALHAAQTLGDVAAEANARRVLGAAALRVDLIAPAIDHLEHALVLYRQVGDQSLEAATLNNIGGALALYEELGDQRMRAPATKQPRAPPVHAGPARRGVPTVRAVVGHREGQRRPARRGERLVRSGRGQRGAGPVRANTGLRTSRPDPRAGRRSPPPECAATRMLGVGHRQSGENEQAIRHLDTALRLARAVGETEQLVASLNGLATTQASAGNPSALHLYHEALVENESVFPDERTHAGIGDVHAALGDHDQAAEHWRQALVLYRHLGMPQAHTVATKLSNRS